MTDLADVERNEKVLSKPVSQHFNLMPNHSNKLMAVCGISLHHG